MRDTIDMAREAVIGYPDCDPNDIPPLEGDELAVFKRFEALVRADEREACAKVAEAVLQEPVEYQYRTRPDWIPEWNGWNSCGKDSADAYEKTPYLHDWHYEVRRLYTTPPAQRQWVGLTNEEIKIIWHDIDGSEGMLIRFARAIEAKLREKNGGAA